MSYRVYSNPTATIANGATTSGEVDTKGLHLIGLTFPAGFDGTTVEIHRAPATGGTFSRVRKVDNDGIYTLSVTAGEYVPIDPAITLGIQYFKIKSAATESAERAIECVCVPVVR